MKQCEEWLFKAEHDLKASKILVTSEQNITDTAIFHTQQCAEKSLKAYLSYRDIEILKTHDLKVLIKKCIEIDKDFEVFILESNFLNPFATFFRYPGSDSFPDSDTVNKAIEYAESIYKFVISKIK